MFNKMKINFIYAQMVYDYFPTYPTQLILHLLIPTNKKTCTTIKHVGITKILSSLS